MLRALPKWSPLFRLSSFNSRQTRYFTVLAIESSADDTCAAVVDSSRKILSNVVIKQLSLHEKFKGIEPITAIEAHQKNMPRAVSQALREANVDIVRHVDGIAFTRGPGMPGCLSVGMNAAKTLAAALRKPVVGVHHMQGHALTPFLTCEKDVPQFPFLTLLVSGGHTLLLLAENPHKFKILSNTVDQAIGRVIDKVSTLLALPWTNLGPGDALERFCESEDGLTPIYLGQPIMWKRPEFSFSGLHSQVERYIAARGGIEKIGIMTRKALAFSFQSAAFAQLEEKLLIGLSLCLSQGIDIRHVVVSGGVASNQYLRKRLKQALQEVKKETPISLVLPPPNMCTDNAAMIAWASMYRFLENDYDDYGLTLRAKWSIDELSLMLYRKPVTLQSL